MKNRLLVLCFCLMMSIFALSFSSVVKAENQDYISGGTDKVTFSDDCQSFALYTEFNQPMYYLQNRLYAPSLAESKAVYQGGPFTDVQVEVTITSINKNGLIDSGIYVQASDPGNKINQITAWCVNVERDVNSNYAIIRLHRFLNNSWDGYKCQATINNVGDSYNLKVVVKSGVLYVYINGGECLFNYYIGSNEGMVGLRTYYAPNYFTDFKVTAPSIEFDTSLFEQKIIELENIDSSLYTNDTITALKKEIEAAKILLNTEVSQPLMEECFSRLIKAENSLVKLCTKDDLAELVEIGNAAVSQTDVYTKNSIASLKVVLAECDKALQSDDNQEISYWYQKLEYKLDTLIRYGG